MEQELIKPDVPPKGSSQAISPLGCFIAASGITLLTLCLLGTAALTTIWAFSKLLGLPEILSQGLMALGLIPATIKVLDAVHKPGS